MSDVPAVLAIDGGNSKTDMALVADDGTVLAELRGPGASQERLGVQGAMEALTALVRSLAGSASGPVARHTSACLAGADLPSEEEALADAVQAQGWSATSAVLNDTFAVLRAGVPYERPWGIGVVCGAGINCVGVAPGGRATRFLAFGTITGDWGAGAGLSQQVMWWAMRAEDGRGVPTSLRPATAAYFGMESVADVAIAVHTEQITDDDLLGLTTVLFSAATEGDPVAVDLVERQGDEIALMALTAMRRLGLESLPGTPVVLGGGLVQARHPQLTSAITRRLAAGAPGAVPQITDTPPIAGAALLGLDYLAGLADSGAAVASPDAERRLRQAWADAGPGPH